MPMAREITAVVGEYHSFHFLYKWKSYELYFSRLEKQKNMEKYLSLLELAYMQCYIIL